MANEDKLQLAKEALASGTYDKETIEYIFPELRESEDEKIRKEIIQFLQLPHPQFVGKRNYEEWIAWLEKQDTKLQEYINEERNKKDFYCEGKEMSWNEMPLGVKKHDYPYYFKGDLDCYPFNTEKQGEQKPIEQDTETHDLWMYIREWNDKFGRLPNDEDELAACIDYVMKRQKPTDKIEPKFKVGDWLVSDCNNVVYIESISETKYNLQCIDGHHNKMSVEYVDRCWRLWTIKDAKDGDMLVNKHGCPLIFKDRETCWCYYSISMEVFRPTNNRWFFSSDYLCPATKKQRDLLFQKMKEAGYEWDVEKKELKKIETLTSLDEAIEHCKEKSCGNNACALEHKQLEKWLTESKELKEQKPIWSKEDESRISWLIKHFNQGEGLYDDLINWFKSLKPNHWKPSEKQMEELARITRGNSYPHLSSLYDELKKL